MEKLKNQKIHGYSLPIFILFGIVLFIAMLTGSLGKDMMSTMVFTFVLGLILMKIGDSIPIFNKYLSGGMLLAFFVPSYFVFKGWIPKVYVGSVKTFFSFGGAEYITFFIVLLMANSLIMMDRKMLIKSVTRFVPLLIITIIGAIVGTYVVAMFFGINIGKTVAYCVLPIMGSGTSGAAALSQIFSKSTGGSAKAYYAQIVVIVILANTLCMFVAVALNAIGAKFPKLTGDKKTLMRSQNNENASSKNAELPKASLIDAASGLILAGVLYTVAGICAKLIPSVKGIEIHQYAYFVVILIIVNVTDIIPANIKAGLKTVTSFCSGILMPMICVCISIVLIDMNSFLHAFNFQTIVLAVACIISACLTAAIFGHLFGMYAIDAALTAALCQADMGGGAAVGILGPADRMELMPYGQIASRIGYGFVLIFASILFPLLL